MRDAIPWRSAGVDNQRLEVLHDGGEVGLVACPLEPPQAYKRTSSGAVRYWAICRPVFSLFVENNSLFRRKKIRAARIASRPRDRLSGTVVPKELWQPGDVRRDPPHLSWHRIAFLQH